MSGFGGSSLFPQNTSQPAQAPSLFPSLNTSQPQQTSSNTPQLSGGLFGSTVNTSQAQPGGSLFGSNANTSQPQPSGGLFGATSNTNQAQPSGGLLGSSFNTNQNQNQNQNQTGGGLFGSLNTGNSQIQQSASLFGSSSAAPKTSGGLFGQPSTQQGPTSLFGNSLNQNNTQAKPTLSFGNSGNQSTNQTQQKPSLFGTQSLSQPNQTQQSFLGSNTLPQLGSLQQQSQTVPGVKIDVSNIRGTTRFNDLHEELQKQIEQIDNFIQQQIAYKDQCDALMPAHGQNLSTIPTDVQYLKGLAEAVELAIDNDTRSVREVKKLVTKDADDARISFRAAENIKLPQQFHYSGMWHSSSSMAPSRAGNSSGDVTNGNADEPADLISLFHTVTSEMTARIGLYEQSIKDVESHLRLVEANAIAETQQLMFRRGRGTDEERSQNDQVKELAAVLRQFEEGILSVANKVGILREEVHTLLLQGRRSVR